MSNKKIVSMRLENFLSFGNADFDFDRAGLTFVAGENLDDPSADSNGSGKSAMICALVWCLTGTTLRGYENDEVVHRKVGEGCLVSVCLTDGDELYTISRARRHPKLKNSLRVTHDNFGEDMSKPGLAETQEVVDRLLSCSRKTFLSSVVFGQDRAYRFSSLTDAEQKKILDEVLGVERFAQACAGARAQVSGLQSEIANVKRSLEKAETARDEAEAEAADLQAKHADFEADRRKRVQAEQEKLRGAKDWVSKTRKVANVDALKATANDALKTLAAVEKRRDKWVGTDAEARSAVAGSKLQLDEATAELKKRQKAPSRCSTCGQQVTAKAGADLVSAARVRVDELKKSYASWSAIADEAATTVVACRQEVKEARDAMTLAQKNLNEGVGAAVNAATWRKRAVDHEERIAELEHETSPYAELADKAFVRHARHEAEAETHAAEVADHESQLLRAEFWVKAFGARGLRSLLIDSSLPLLNQEASRVSRAVTGGAIAVEFSATSEQKSGKVVDKFEVRVDNKHGAGDYRGNSAGERAKVDLCVGLALQRLVASRSSASFNLCFFDEAFDHLDSAAHERVIEVLAEIDKESVFVVSHNEDLRAFFPNVLTIKKQGGFSSVEQ